MSNEDVPTLLRLPALPPGMYALNSVKGAQVDRLFPEESHFSVDNCVTCGGSGTFRWWAPGAYGREVAEYACPCIDQYKLYRNFLYAGIKLTYQRLSWRDVEVESGAVAKVEAYLDRSRDFISQGFGLILHGSIGSGKTLLATLLLKHLVAEGCDGYFTTFADVINAFMGAWRDREEREWFQARVKNVEVLVVDDIGREFKQRRIVTRALMEKLEVDTASIDFKTQQAEAAFDDVLRHRVASSKPTIITSNLSIEELLEYGENVMSLLQERSSTYRFTGTDFRPRHRVRLMDEVEMGLRRPVVVG